MASDFKLNKAGRKQLFAIACSNDRVRPYVHLLFLHRASEKLDHRVDGLELGNRVGVPVAHIEAVYAMVKLLGRTMKEEKVYVRAHAIV